MDTKKHSTRQAVKIAPYRRGRPSGRRKPLKEQLLRAGVTYVVVARESNRSYRTVQEHINGTFFSPAVQAAIDKLTGSAA
jgi:hypothetical protein